MKNFLVATVCALVHIASVSAQTTAPPTKAKPAEIVVGFGVIVQAAKKAGVAKCAARIDQHEKFFVQKNNPVSAIMFVAPKDPNNRLFSLSLELLEQNESAYVSATYAPATTGKDDCPASYDLVKYWPDNCQEVAAKVYPQFGDASVLNRQVSVLGKEPNVKIFLMVAGEGCVSIKKEIVF